jgi:hypothetical protein
LTAPRPLGTAGGPDTARSGRWRVWVEDVFASGSALSLLAALAGMIYLLLDPERLARVWRSYWPALILCALLVLAVTTVMWLWMLADCGARVARGHDPRLIAWLAVMGIVSPAAWLYYFVERRPRQSRC